MHKVDITTHRKATSHHINMQLFHCPYQVGYILRTKRIILKILNCFQCIVGGIVGFVILTVRCVLWDKVKE